MKFWLLVVKFMVLLVVVATVAAEAAAAATMVMERWWRCGGRAGAEGNARDADNKDSAGAFIKREAGGRMELMQANFLMYYERASFFGVSSIAL